MEVLQVSYKSPTAAQDFTRSIQETGFAVVSDHPISKDLIMGTFEDWKQFFNTEEKFEHKFDPASQAGYFPFKSENAKDYAHKDLKEFFHLFPQTPIPKSLSSRTKELFGELSTMAAHLLTWVNDQTPDEVKRHFSQPLQKMATGSDRVLFRVIHYPPLKGDEVPGEIRAAAHEDINLITLLPAATEPGLQVQDKQGRWYDVPCDPGNIVVNAGDMLQLASRGYYKSTTHRVINPTGEGARRARYSMPLFFHPRPEVVLSEKHTADSYLTERLREIGLK